jgi:hypothetical protein
MASAKKTKKKRSIHPSTAIPDDDWMSRDDARTLADAAAIKKDADRMKKAAAAAKKMLAEEQKSAADQKARAVEIGKLANRQAKSKA